MTESQGSQAMMLSLATAGPTSRMQRLALVVHDSQTSSTAAALRLAVPTFSVTTLSELRSALTQHYKQQLMADDSEAPSLQRNSVGLDLTRLSVEEIELFAANLQRTTNLGVVYVVTPKQFDIFEPGVFDFVVR